MALIQRTKQMYLFPCGKKKIKKQPQQTKWKTHSAQGFLLFIINSTFRGIPPHFFLHLNTFQFEVTNAFHKRSHCSLFRFFIAKTETEDQTHSALQDVHTRVILAEDQQNQTVKHTTASNGQKTKGMVQDSAQVPEFTSKSFKYLKNVVSFITRN